MITIRSNTSQVIASIISKVRALGNTDQLLRTMAEDTLPAVKQRIHKDGIAADGKPIGTYSPGYLKFRQKGYKSDTITRGEKKGEPRPVKKFKRTNDNKVVASLSRQMENDWSIIPTSRGYGLGFTNEANAEKMDHVEKTYKKPIAKLTKEEREGCLESAKAYRDRIFNG